MRLKSAALYMWKKFKRPLNGGAPYNPQRPLVWKIGEDPGPPGKTGRIELEHSLLSLSSKS